MVSKELKLLKVETLKNFKSFDTCGFTMFLYVTLTLIKEKR